MLVEVDGLLLVVVPASVLLSVSTSAITSPLTTFLPSVLLPLPQIVAHVLLIIDAVEVRSVEFEADSPLVSSLKFPFEALFALFPLQFGG